MHQLPGIHAAPEESLRSRLHAGGEAEAHRFPARHSLLSFEPVRRPTGWISIIISVAIVATDSERHPSVARRSAPASSSGGRRGHHGRCHFHAQRRVGGVQQLPAESKPAKRTTGGQAGVIARSAHVVRCGLRRASGTAIGRVAAVRRRSVSGRLSGGELRRSTGVLGAAACGQLAGRVLPSLGTG